jgi:flagellar basal body-associated protein FliL
MGTDTHSGLGRAERSKTERSDTGLAGVVADVVTGRESIAAGRGGVVFVVCLVVLPTVAVGGGTATPIAGRSAPSAVGPPSDVTGGSAAAQQAPNGSFPSTADGYLAAFNAIEGQPTYRAFSEFEIVRSQADLETQIGSFTATDRRKMGAVLRLLRTFDRAYEAEQNESFATALQYANRTDRIATNLSNNGGRQYALLADVALDRFYVRIGERLLSSAEQQGRTPDRIETLSRAATAFKRGGAVNRFSQLTLRITNLTERYQRDRAAINASLQTTNSFVTACGGCGSLTTAIKRHTLGVFASYSRSRVVRSEATTAVALADKHGLSQVRQQARNRVQRVRSLQTSLAMASVTLIGGFTLVVAVVTAILTHRLVAWRRDLEDAQLGDVVLMGEMLDV